VLRSANANAQQKEGVAGDVERLYVNAAYANQGPSQKRIRPAPMGRAFRVVKRTAHLTVQVQERPSPIVAAPASQAPAEGGEKPARKRAPTRAAKAGARKKTTGGARTKAAARGGARKKKTAKR
jgi:large subunit ribosomal protein L22